MTILTPDDLTELQRVHLRIADKDFHNWSDVTLEQQLDCVSTCSFSAPFEPDREDFRKLFRPFTFPRVEVYVGGVLRFTGRLVDISPQRAADRATVSVTCYGLPGTLADCCMPWGRERTSGQFTGLRLPQIATRLCAPFGIGVSVDDRSSTVSTIAGRDRTSPFKVAKIETDQKIWDFLCELARQRGLVLTDDAEGNLLIRKSLPVGAAAPVVELFEGKPPLLSVASTFSPQDYFSDVTVIAKAHRGQASSGWTARNPFLRDVLRPTTHRCDDVQKGDSQLTADDRLARMLANCASWDVELPTAVDPSGELYRPNTLVNLQAPGAMIYGKHSFLVRTVTMRQDANSTTCKLGLALPGAFSGQMPPVLPWSEVA